MDWLKLMHAIAIGGIVAVILAHALVPSKFLVDSTTVGLLVLLCAVVAVPFWPQLTKYIAELTVLGNTVKFREHMERAEQLVEVVEKQAEESKLVTSEHIRETKGSTQRWPGFIEVSENLYRLLDQDPRLAVAGLGIQLEEVLHEAAQRVVRGDDSGLDVDRMSLGRVIQFLRRRERITYEQGALFAQLLELRNLAVHGREITRDDAQRFFTLVERLNESVPLGYSLDFEPNDDWESQGLVCRYEHCIEHMPVRDHRDEGSCGIFGHECPGGSEQVNECRKAGVFAAFRGEDDEQ